MVQLVGSVLVAVLSRACNFHWGGGGKPKGRKLRPKAESWVRVLLDGKEVASPLPISIDVPHSFCSVANLGEGRAGGAMPPVASPTVRLVCYMITCHRYGSYQQHSFLICWSVSVYFIAICYISISYICFVILVGLFCSTF